MYRQMYGTEAPPNVISAMSGKSVGELADALRAYGPGGGTSSALGGDLLSGIKGIQEELGLPTALEIYNRISDLLSNLPGDIEERARTSQQPITESQRRSMLAAESEPLFRKLESAKNYANLLQTLAAPRISALEQQYAVQNQPSVSNALEPYEFRTVGPESGGYIFNPNTGTYSSLGGYGGGGGSAAITGGQPLPELPSANVPQTQQLSTGSNKSGLLRNILGGPMDWLKARAIEQSGAIPSAEGAITSAKNLFNLF